MKKLMIGAMALAAAFAANAGAVNWNVSDVYSDAGDSEIDNYAVYFFVDSGTGYTGAQVLQTAALEALGNNDLSFIDNAVAGDAGSFALTEWGGAGDTNVGKGLFGETAAVKGYAIVFNAEEAASATKAYVLDTEDVIVNLGSGSVDFSAAGSAVPDAWTTIGAPEPTSGLLLLIGVAGLALKRKRA